MIQEQQLDAFTINGFKVRTTNRKESQIETANIAPLWQHFYRDLMPHLSSKAQVYGIYTNYEYDHTASFDVIACTDQKILHDISGLITRHIPEQHYLKFSKKGKMPETVISLWQDIWTYFDSANCKHVRVYTQDIEHFTSSESVDIFIAIQ